MITAIRIYTHMTHKHTHEILHQVPVDYYQKGVRSNLLQKLWHTNKLHALLDLVDESQIQPKKILDVGCASGWLLSEMKKVYPKSSCTGVDLYDKAIAWGNKKYKTVSLLRADAHKLPFRKETFDVIICTEVLEHVEDPGKVLLEIKRVLKKNGRAIIEMDSGNWLFTAIWYVWTHFLKGKVWDHAHIQMFNSLNLAKTIKKSGLKIVSQKNFNATMAVAFLVKK